MKWEKKNSKNMTIKDVIEQNSGCSIHELLHPDSTDPKEIQNLEAAAEYISSAVAKNIPISIMGDYDADGVTASAILYCVLKKLGTTPYVRLPQRMTEGYGLNVSVIGEFKKGLLITVDNGIAAHEAIKAARDAGIDVISAVLGPRYDEASFQTRR